eukprot:scaffold7301_cov53-Cyclotella_meneghiniana.AAC.1
MDLSEALSILPFANLPPPDVSYNKKPSTRTIICSPSKPPPSYHGVVFRHCNTQIQAVLVRPPSLPAATGDEEAVAIEGGDFSIIGKFDLSKSVIHMASSTDGRLLLLVCSDASLYCLNVMYLNSNNHETVEFTTRWESNIHALKTTNMHGMHYDVSFNLDGSVKERRWSEDERSTKNDNYKIQVRSLEFINHSFLMVVELEGDTRVLWMEGSGVDSPSVNYWDLDIDAENEGAVICACACPSKNDTITIAFGTNKGKLGMLQTSSTGKIVKFIQHSLEQEGDMPMWEVSHLNWFAPTSLAVGFTRVIIEQDIDEDDEEEDDPNEHQANLLVGNLNNGSFLDSSSWTWSELGDVVPFFSIPKDGNHVFYTTALSSMLSSPSSMLLVGCNVGSDVILLSLDQESCEWKILDLMEGRQMMCPTDEDDEFLYLMGLVVLILPTDMENKSYPFPILASSDGATSGFVPYHQGVGQEYFSTIPVGDGIAPSQEELVTPIRASNSITSFFLPVPKDQNTDKMTSLNQPGECILSGLDLGLDQLEKEVSATSSAAKPSHLEQRFNEDESQDESNNSDSDYISPDDYSEDEKPRNTSESSAFGSGLATAAFSFDQPSFSFQSSTAPISSNEKTSFGTSTVAGGFSFGTTGKATFGSPSALGGSAVSTKPSKAEDPAAAVFGSTTNSGGVFGSTSSGGFIDFGKIKSPSEAKGFGSQVQAEAHKGDKPQESRETVKTSVPAFGSGTGNPTLSFGTPAGGFSFGEIAVSSKASSSKTSPFETFGQPASSSTVPATMCKPLFGGDGNDSLLVADFGKLIESMGTTYCEEEHRRTIKNISTVDSSSGEKVITKKAFVDWYVDWLFGDGDSDSEGNCSSDGVGSRDEHTSGADAKPEGWGSIFKASEEGSWKCGVCMVTNNPSAKACAACDTAKP